MKIDTSTRTDKAEIMDDFQLQGAALEQTLQDLDNINKWLGGNRITLSGIKLLLKNHKPQQPLHIGDIGCGNGAMLREIADWCSKRDLQIRLTGVDANKHAIEIAQKLSASYPEIQYCTDDIFSAEFKRRQFDIILCTLTLHHFKTEEIQHIMINFCRQSKVGVVINDLHRSKQAYVLFKAFCRVFIDNPIARQDGLTSILRGFKKKELLYIASHLPTDNKQIIKWKWAYRFQWVIKKQDNI